MRHNKSGRKLNRSSSHRKAMFRNMAKALVTYERIRTTEPRAKELSKVVDRLVTLALKNDLPARRQAYKVLGNHGLVKRLFDEIGPRFVGVKGGFTRVVKLGKPRGGDAAPMAIIELTARASEEAKDEKPKKKAAAKKTAPKKEAPAKDGAKDEAPAEEAPKKKAPAKKPAAKKAAPKKAAAKKDEGEDKPKKAPAKKAAPKKAAPKKDEAKAEEAPAEEPKAEPEADKE
jgi:large subunit ribosomal protein L17